MFIGARLTTRSWKARTRVLPHRREHAASRGDLGCAPLLEPFEHGVVLGVHLSPEARELLCSRAVRPIPAPIPVRGGKNRAPLEGAVRGKRHGELHADLSSGR